MKQCEQTINVSIHLGMATLPTGQVIDLKKIQAKVNEAFQETGEIEYAEAADQLSLLSGYYQGPHAEFFPNEDLDNSQD